MNVSMPLQEHAGEGCKQPAVLGGAHTCKSAYEGPEKGLSAASRDRGRALPRCLAGRLQGGAAAHVNWKFWAGFDVPTPATASGFSRPIHLRQALTCPRRQQPQGSQGRYT
eukprot:362506-Chlamydomonas_euryale.AAC.5